MVPQIRTYQVPDTRLPFVNAEFARIERRGRTELVTSVWGGPGNGRIYLIDPRSGDCEMRLLPEGEPGAYMLKTAPDGRLYLGTGTGNLLRYDPRRDAFETLVKGQMSGITWGGCVTGRHVVWAASPGYACVYDWREGRLLHALKPLDVEAPPALYGYNAIECPDGKVLACMNVPQTRMILLDPASAERRPIVTEEMRGKEWVDNATFLDSQTLAVSCGDHAMHGDLLLYRYPSFELLGRAPKPEGAERIGGRRSLCSCGGRFYALSAPDGSLWRLAADRGRWEPVRRGMIGPEPNSYYELILTSVEDRSLCAVTTMGEFFRLDLDTGEVFSRELDACGPPIVEHHPAFCVVPEIGKIYGAPYINQRFWEINIASGKGADLGRAAQGAGQIDCMVWDPHTRRILMASYTTCTITAYDPSKPARWPENPKLLASIGENQMRPKVMVHDGRFAWLVSSAHYGHLGGALSRIDPRDGSTRVWRHVVKDQTPNSIVLDAPRRRLYLSTEIHADCDSAPPTERAAKLVAFDMDALKVLRELAPFDACPVLHLLAMLSSGRLLGKANEKLFAWEPDTNALEDLGPAPQGIREVAAAPDGSLYTSARGHIGRLRVGADGVEFQPLVPGRGRFTVAGDSLWFVAGQNVQAMKLS